MVRRVVAALLAAAVLPVTAVVSPAQAAEIREITLPIAPEGVSAVYWSDTFGALRSGGRSHVGVDMMGPKMTPLVAVADGVVTWMRHDSSAGNNLEITDADGWSYHYIHINNDTPGTDDGANAFEYAFAPGIERGATVKAGQIVAYMGDSGNAESTGSHLHFEIERPDSSNLNPTPSVDAALDRLTNVDVLKALNISSTAELSVLFDEMSVAVVGRTLTDTERATLIQDLALTGLGATLEKWVGVESRAASIDRLYRAFFLRLPDAEGLRYWIEQSANGSNLAVLADVFAASPEYQLRYPDMSFSDFLDQLYEEVLGRSPDVGGRDYWLELLEDGTITRGAIVVQFTESVELKNITGVRSEAISLYNLFEGRIPSDAEIAAWIELRGSDSLAGVIETQFAVADL